MATRGGGGGNGERSVDDMTFVAILIGGLAVGAFIIWLVARAQITMAYVYLRRLQLGWLDAIGSLGIPGADSVHAWFQKTCAASGLFERCTRDFSNARWAELANSSLYINLFLLAFIVGFGAWIFLRLQATHPSVLYGRKLDVAKFIRNKKSMYSHLKMFDAIDLIAAPLTDDKLGMSLTSRQFAYRHRLVAGWIDEADGSCTPTLDRAKAEEVFKAQLGAVWTGSANLSPAEVMLMAIAIPRVAATNGALDDAEFKTCLKETDRMIEWCWAQFRPGKGQEWLSPQVDLAIPRQVIAKYIDAPPMVALLRKHAYVRTILFGMFASGRSLGVLPPADMRWLRFFDRPLWYVLQNMGRQAVYAEGAAPYCHFLYEVKSKEGLVEAQLDKAVSGLETALTAFKYEPADRDSYNKGATSIQEKLDTPDADNEPMLNTQTGKNDKKTE